MIHGIQVTKRFNIIGRDNPKTQNAPEGVEPARPAQKASSW